MSALTEDDTLIIEFLEFGVPCMFGVGHDAVVMMSCLFCPNNAGALCSAHADAERAEVERLISRQGFVRCAFCFAKGATFDDVFGVVKL